MCGLRYAVDQWFSHPANAIRRLPNGRAYYRKQVAKDRQDMLQMRERMLDGFGMLDQATKEFVRSALEEDLGAARLGHDAAAAFPWRRELRIGSWNVLPILSWALRHPIALIYPNEDKSHWVLQMVNEDRFGQYPIIPLLFTGDLGVRLICSEWGAMNLPGVHREVPANYRRDKLISVTLDSLRPAPKAAPGDPKNVKASSSGKPVKINVKSRIAADGDAAVIKEPVVPRAANKKADQKPPSNKRRSDGAHHERERRWYVQGKAVHPEHGQLRRETLSDEMAEIYWNRALILVAEVDKQQGSPKYQTMFEDRQTGYLAIHELRYYLVECVAGKLIQGKSSTPSRGPSTPWCMPLSGRSS